MAEKRDIKILARCIIDETAKLDLFLAKILTKESYEAFCSIEKYADLIHDGIATLKQDEIAALEKGIKELQDENKEKTKETNDLSEEIESFKNEVAELKEEVSTLQSDLDKSDKNYNILLENHDTLKNELKTLKILQSDY